jgi:hypothetical protein
MEQCEIDSRLQQIGFTLGTWGYSGEPSYFIRPLDKRFSASGDWNSVEEISELPSKRECYNVGLGMEEFAEKLGIPLNGQKPRWLMVSSYG